MATGGPHGPTSWCLSSPWPCFSGQSSDGLNKTTFSPLVDAPVWHKDWVVHCAPVDRGQEAFGYLAPYIFRVAISNNRILKLAEGEVTFQYKESASEQVKSVPLPAEEFIRRFLQHVLPTICQSALLRPAQPWKPCICSSGPDSCSAAVPSTPR